MSEIPSRRTSALRWAGWALFGVLVIGWSALWLTEMSAGAELVIGTTIIYLLPMVLALMGSFALALNCDGVERHFWGLVAAATACLFGAELYWTWYVTSVGARGPQLPATFEVLQATAALMLLALAIAMTTSARSPRVTHVRFYLDVVGAMIVFVSAAYWFVTLRMFAGVPGGGWRVSTVAAWYLVIGVTLLFVSLLAIVGGRGWRWRTWERLLVASLVIYGVGLLTFPAWYRTLLLSSNPLALEWFSVVLGFGYYLLFMAIVYRATTSAAPDASDVWRIPRLRRRRMPVLYPVALALALPLLGRLAFHVGNEPYGAPIVVAAFALAGILIVRSWLTAVERAYHRELAITDPVSGAFNHRYLHEHLSEYLVRASVANAPLAIIVVDVDEFKGINDSHGHLSGDEVLRCVAELLQSSFGSTARVFRFGSDEFVVSIPGTDAERATEYARFAHDRVSRDIKVGGAPVTLSAGIAIYPTHAGDADQLLSRALAAQQLAKVAGADDVIVYDERVVGAIDPFERLERARRRSHRATVATLAAAVDARDTDTLHHSENVAELATALAQVLGMSEQQIRVVSLSAKLHDIGKIGVRDDVLLKTGALNAQERAHVEEHPILGERILAPTLLDEILPAVRHHHERWDGTGYPDGLCGPQIPVEARVLSVCDSFEAMTATRSYRTALSVGHALAEIEKEAGSQFDPDVAAAFVRMVTHLHGYAGHDHASRQSAPWQAGVDSVR